MSPKMVAPFHFLFWRTSCHYDLVELMITFEDKLPGERGSVALETSFLLACQVKYGMGRKGYQKLTSAVVDFFDLNIVKTYASLNCIDVVRSASRSET